LEQHNQGGNDGGLRWPDKPPGGRIEPPKDAAAELHHKKMIEALDTLARILAQNTDALHSEVAKIQEHHPDMLGVDALVVAKDKVVRATYSGRSRTLGVLGHDVPSKRAHSGSDSEARMARGAIERRMRG